MYGATFFGPSYFGTAFWGSGGGTSGATTAAATRGPYQFVNIKVAQIIEDAYQRIQFDLAGLNAMHMASARRSMNLLFSEWSNKNLNLWTVEPRLMMLTPNQATYSLIDGTVDVTECLLRTYTRPEGVNTSSAGGVANNAFDNDLATACTQTSANGSISVDYGSGTEQTVQMVGVCSRTEQDYTLVFEYSRDGSTWTTIASLDKFTYPATITQWLVVMAPVAARHFRIRETGGATLDISEAYFCTHPIDTRLGRISRSSYAAIGDKFSSGRPSAFTINRLRTPTLSIYPPPIGTYNLLLYNSIRHMYDVDASADTLDIPQRFFEALVSGLAAKLARKFQPSVATELKNEAEIAFNIAAAEDRDRAPLGIAPDTAGWVS